MHQLEFILDSLVDEKDRSTQKRGDSGGGRATAGGGAGHGSAASASDGSSQLSLEISVSRPAEIEAALQQFVSPKVKRKRTVVLVFEGMCLRRKETLFEVPELEREKNGHACGAFSKPFVEDTKSVKIMEIRRGYGNRQACWKAKASTMKF